MARTKKYEDNAFTNLVKAIDAKWGHTYQDIEPTVEDLLAEIREMQSEKILKELD